MTETGSSERTRNVGERPARRRPRVWRRVLLLFVVFQTPFFLNGCDRSSVYYSAGVVVPYCEFELDDDFWFQRVVSFSILGCAANLLLIGGGLLAAARCWPWLGRQLESRLFLIVLLLTVWVFDSFWFWPALWWNLVGFHTINLANTTHEFVLGADAGAAPVSSWAYVTGARVYFVAWLVGGHFGLSGAGWLYRRFFTVTPQRWWQISLGGALAAMLILGTALGLLLRLLSD